MFRQMAHHLAHNTRDSRLWMTIHMQHFINVFYRHFIVEHKNIAKLYGFVMQINIPMKKIIKSQSSAIGFVYLDIDRIDCSILNNIQVNRNAEEQH